MSIKNSLSVASDQGLFVRSKLVGRTQFLQSTELSLICSVAITCRDLPHLLNGIIIFSTSTPAPYAFGTTATYTCDDGFGLSRVMDILTCGGDGSSANGMWSNVVPTCQGN